MDLAKIKDHLACDYSEEGVMLMDQKQMDCNRQYIIDKAGTDLVYNGTTLIFCTTGTMNIAVGGQNYPIIPDTLFLTLPNEMLHIAEISNDFNGLFVLMTADFLNSLNLSETLNVHLGIKRNHLYSMSEQQKEAFPMMHAQMKALIQLDDNPYQGRLLRLQTEMFFYSFGYSMHKNTDTTDKSMMEVQCEMFFVTLEREYRKHHDVEYYAAQLCISPKYLSHCLKSTTNMTAKQWIERQLISHACNRLQGSSATVGEIAAELGFDDPSHFGRFFLRHTSTSPHAWRLGHKQDNE